MRIALATLLWVFANSAGLALYLLWVAPPFAWPY
jgi:hypothetical protein